MRFQDTPGPSEEGISRVVRAATSLLVPEILVQILLHHPINQMSIKSRLLADLGPVALKTRVQALRPITLESRRILVRRPDRGDKTLRKERQYPE